MANWFREIARKAEREGWKKGFAQGLIEGRLEAQIEGRAEAERAATLRLLTMFIDAVAPHLRDALLPWSAAASTDDLHWLVRHLATPTLDDDLLRVVAARPTRAPAATSPQLPDAPP